MDDSEILKIDNHQSLDEQVTQASPFQRNLRVLSRRWTLKQEDEELILILLWFILTWGKGPGVRLAMLERPLLLKGLVFSFNVVVHYDDGGPN